MVSRDRSNVIAPPPGSVMMLTLSPAHTPNCSPVFGGAAFLYWDMSMGFPVRGCRITYCSFPVAGGPSESTSHRAESLTGELEHSCPGHRLPSLECRDDRKVLPSPS